MSQFRDTIQNVRNAFSEICILTQRFPEAPLFVHTAYEMEHAIVHIAQSYMRTSGTENNKKISDLNEALKHLRRGRLDFYKCLIFREESGVFERHGRNFAFLRELMRARKTEIEEIGSGSFTNTFAQYGALLERYYVESSGTSTPASDQTTASSSSAYEQAPAQRMFEYAAVWNRLEVLFSALYNGKEQEVLRAFLKAFLSADINTLKKCILQLQTLITAMVLDIDRNSEEGTVRFPTYRAASHDLPDACEPERLYSLLSETLDDRDDAVRDSFPVVLKMLDLSPEFLHPHARHAPQ